MDRRQFLRLAGLMAAGSGLLGCNALAAPAAGERLATAPRQAPAPSSPARHVLNRLSFGPRPGQVAEVEALGPEAYIERQLKPQTLDTRRAEAIEAELDALEQSVSERGFFGQLSSAYQIQAATMARMLYSEQQLYEVLVDFWSNHFNVYLFKGVGRLLKIEDDRQAIRPHALGNFGELLRASAHSPAMLFYLDNFRSEASHPNENYARELLELHTLGVDGGYTQQDVMEVARAFTGWSLMERDSETPGEFIFRPDMHDDGPKTVLGHDIPAGGGKADGDIVLDILARHPSTARHVCRKLGRRFISDEPPPAAIEATAATFRRTGGDIPAVLRTLFKRDEFWAAAGQKVKRPLEFMVSALRALDIETDNMRGLRRAARQLGQAPFMWAAPDGYPDTTAHWINANSLLVRWNMALEFTDSRPIRRYLQGPLRRLDNPAPATVLETYAGLILNQPPPPDIKPVLLSLLKKDMAGNVPTVVGLLLASPHFQYR